MRLFPIVVISAMAFAPLAAMGQEMSPKSSTVTPDHFDLKEVDPSVDPCVDFYEYACKKWQASNPIPPDQASWRNGPRPSCLRVNSP